jgi:trimeric autotransporter adhesin
VPSSVVAGTTGTMNTTVLNQGGGVAAAAATTRFYLSTNLSLDASDVLVGSRSIGALAAGQSDAGPTSIAIPAGTPAGAYFVLVVADGDGVVAETSETNNIRAAYIIISGTIGGIS